MGNAYCINFNFLLEFQFADFIAVVGIIVNTILALKIVNSIQNKLTNERTLKDHFISEIKEIRADYVGFIKSLHNESIVPSDTLVWLKDMNIKTRDLMVNLNNKYNVPLDELHAYQNDLREVITESNEFIKNFNNKNPTLLDEVTMFDITRLNRKNQSNFNSIIVAINDYSLQR